MRLLLLMPSLTGTGGAERMVDGLSRLLSSAGVEAFEASFDSPGVRRRLRIPHPSIRSGPCRACRCLSGRWNISWRRGGSGPSNRG